MKVRRIDIERLYLVMPRPELPRTHAASVHLARATVASLAKALEQNALPPASQQIPKLQVQAPRRQLNPAGIASAIHTSVVRFNPPAKRGQ